MPVPVPEPGQTVAGYRLLRPIGHGATGTVFLAEAAGTKAAVALKVIELPTDGSALGDPGPAFLRAAEAAQSLRHPDIVAVHRAGLLPQRGWLAMELVPGTDLARYTRADRLLPERLVLRLGARLAAALAHAHTHGIVHRDLKPANVLVHWPSGSCKLADFGLARSEASDLSRTGMLLGSPAYMAPELLAGAAPHSGSDLYALGVLLFELLSGQRPHSGASMGSLLREIATVDAPDLSEFRALRPGMPLLPPLPPVPPLLVLLVAALLARQPATRPRAATQVAEALQRIDRDWPAAA